MEGQSLKSHCSAAAGFLPKSGGGGGRRRSSFSSSYSSSCWIPPRFLRHPKRTGGSCWISVVEIRTPPLRSLPALSLQQQQQQQEFVNIVEGNDDDASEEKKKKKKKNIDDDEMVRSSGGGRRRRRSSSSSSSVHVKFVLHKECSFGEKFLLVGDDPMFGLWDLQKAIPLKWSEGHFWTAEMDLPLEKSTIQFKFILGDASSSGSGGEFHWQPGPDRVLHIWDTPNTIVVTEDWDKAENQKLTEEEEEDQPPPLLMQQQQLMMITNQDGDGDGDGDGGDNVQQLLACGLTSINPPPPVSADAEPPIADFPNDDDNDVDVVDNKRSQPLDNIMFRSEEANELLECYSSQSRPSS